MGRKVISKRKLRQQERQNERKRQQQALRDEFGYTAMQRKGLTSARPDFPDLRTGDHRERFPSVGGFAPSPPAKRLPPDAKVFPVGHSHKQGMELILPGEIEWMSGKKS